MGDIHCTYKDSMKVSYSEDGHYHIFIPSFFEKDSFSNDEVDFIFDTGAYITVITKDTAEQFGWDEIKPLQTNIPLSGFIGSCEGDLKVIPGMVLGGSYLEDVRVAIPYEDTDMNILGLNIIEHFNYFFNSSVERVYFSDNENYKTPIEFRCGRVHTISDKFSQKCGTGYDMVQKKNKRLEINQEDVSMLTQQQSTKGFSDL